MKYEKYEPLLSSNNAHEFQFTSVGPNGKIVIVVQYNKTDASNIYNLAFGNLLENGDVDDHIRNCNQDRNKILATVAASVYEFTAQYPDVRIFFTGSTPVRTRLYRMALTLNFIELSGDFEIFGVTVSNRIFLIEPFMKGKEYYGFLINRKKVVSLVNENEEEIERSLGAGCEG